MEGGVLSITPVGSSIICVYTILTEVLSSTCRQILIEEKFLPLSVARVGARVNVDYILSCIDRLVATVISCLGDE